MGWDTYKSLEHLAQLVDSHGWEGYQLDGIHVVCIILGDRVGMAVVPLYSYDVTATTASATATTSTTIVSFMHFTLLQCTATTFTDDVIIIIKVIIVSLCRSIAALYIIG
jgi:hypothetical protein